MSQAIVEVVRAKYPTPLGATHGAFLVEVAHALGGGAGLLFKDWGVHVVLPDGRKVAQDIICYLVPGGAVHYDCLVDADGAAIPSWQDKGPVDAGRYLPVSGSPAPVPPTPAPPAPVPPAQPAPPCQCGEVVELLTAMRLENAARHGDVLAQLHRLSTATARARTFRGKARYIGQIDGEVSGVPV